MAWDALLLGAAILAPPPSVAARPTPVTYRYAVTTAHLGAIGDYVRTIDDVDGLDHAQSHLRILVRVLGFTVYREDSDQREVWRGGRLMAFNSLSTINAKPLLVHGEFRGGRLMVTTPAGTKPAPIDIAAADPWSSRRLGPATIVTIRTGEIVRINTTGGEADTVMVGGASTAARHFHVSTPSQANRWEIWLDAGGVPVKFRSLEHGRAIDFTLVKSPDRLAANPTALAR